MVDIFGAVISGAIGWGTGKVLDAVVECLRCQYRFEDRLGNVQLNTIGCTNCWCEVAQFVNACDYTLTEGKRVGMVAATFLGGWKHDSNPSERGLFAPKREGWVYFDTNVRSLDMIGRQFVITGELSDYNSGAVYATSDRIYTPGNHRDWQWNQDHLSLFRNHVPAEHRDGRVFAVDLKIRSPHGDVLSEKRLLANLWN